MRTVAISILMALATGAFAPASATAPAAPTNCDHPAKVLAPAGPTEPFDVYEAVYRAPVVVVNVTVGANGNLEAASIVQSSGRVDVDRAALRAAHESRFAPAMKNCKPIAGTTLFRVGYGSSDNIFILGPGGDVTPGTKPPAK
jgi:TonB family protein